MNSRSRKSDFNNAGDAMTNKPKNLPAEIADKLPKPVPHAADIAKLTTGLATAFASIWFPAVAIAGPILSILIDRYADRPRDLLLNELRKGHIQDLSDEQAAAFIPMTYKFLEAAKEGEYEHNLEILAAYLAGELHQAAPDAAQFSRMVRRVEGLSPADLQVMTMIDLSLSDSSAPTLDEGARGHRPYIAAAFLEGSPHNRHHLVRIAIQESLVDLAARGFLITDGASRSSKHEEYYFPSQSFRELLGRARDRIRRDD
jgi:hypothetical protein